VARRGEGQGSGEVTESRSRKSHEDLTCGKKRGSGWSRRDNGVWVFGEEKGEKDSAGGVRVTGVTGNKIGPDISQRVRQQRQAKSVLCVTGRGWRFWEWESGGKKKGGKELG